MPQYENGFAILEPAIETPSGFDENGFKLVEPPLAPTSSYLGDTLRQIGYGAKQGLAEIPSGLLAAESASQRGPGIIAAKLGKMVGFDTGEPRSLVADALDATGRYFTDVAKHAEEQGAKTGGWQFARKISSALTNLVPYVLAGPLAPVVIGEQVFGNTYATAKDSYRQKFPDAPESEIDTRAVLPAAVTGIASGLLWTFIPRLGGKATGADLLKYGTEGIKDVVVNTLKHMGITGATATADTLQQELISKASYNPDKPLTEIIGDSLGSGAGMAALTGFLSAPRIVRAAFRGGPPPPSPSPPPIIPPPIIPPIERPPNASEIEKGKPLPQLEVRPPVGEAAPLRQLNEQPAEVRQPETPATPVVEPKKAVEPIVAPVAYLGFQKGAGPVPDMQLYNLTADVPGFLKGSTVARETLEKAGFTIPESEAAKETTPSASKGLPVNAQTEVSVKPASAALRDKKTGEIWYGEPTHGQLHDKIPNIESRELESGFADKNGNFITLEQTTAKTGLSSGEELFLMSKKQRNEYFDVQRQQVNLDESLSSEQKDTRLSELNAEQERSKKWKKPSINEPKEGINPFEGIGKEPPGVGIEETKPTTAVDVPPGQSIGTLVGKPTVAPKSGAVSLSTSNEPQDTTRKFIYAKDTDVPAMLSVNSLIRGLVAQHSLPPDQAAELAKVRRVIPMDQAASNPLANVGGLEAAAWAKIAKSFNLRLIFLDFGKNPLNIDGAVVNGVADTIFLSARSNRVLPSLIAHELLHNIRNTHPALYQELFNKLEPLVRRGEFDEFFKRKKSDIKKRGGTARNDVVGEELFADLFHDSFQDKAFWTKLAEKEPSLFQKLATTVLEWLNNLIAKLKADGAYKYFSDIGKAHDAIAETLVEFQRLHGEVPPPEVGRVSLSTSEPTVVDPATGERVRDAEGGTEEANIAGITFTVLGKDRLDPKQKAIADARVQDYFGKELNLPGAADRTEGKGPGSLDTNVVFKITPDGKNHDAEGELLLKHLVEQIQIQHQPGGDPAYVSSLVNAINKNFATGKLREIFSRDMIDRLVSTSVGESSFRGSMLRAVTGIREDMATVARNADFYLRRTYENMFGGDLVRKIMDKIASNFKETVMSGDEIERLYNSNPILQQLFLGVVSRLRVKPSLRDVIQEIFNTRIDKQDDIIQKFVDTMVNKFSATPEEAAKLKAEFSKTFEKSFAGAREKAQEKALAALTPQERKVIGPQTALWKKITNLVNSGWFDSAKVVEDFAKSKGWVVPTEKELERMRNWSILEQSLREPTEQDISNAGGDVEKAKQRVIGATLEQRQDLLRKMNTQWSRWVHPIMRLRSLHRDVLDPVKRYNSAMAVNEWLTANLLLKFGFGSRQLLDVATQTVLHTPTRAAAYAWEQWRNDKSANRDTNLLGNLSQAITDAYRTRLKVLGDTLASFKRTLAGKGEQKNVEQLLSSIAVFDRMLLRADEMKSEGRPAAARFLSLVSMTLRFGRQFAAAADIVQGVPAEAQEIAHQIRTGLREQGLSKAEQDLQFDTIMGLLTTARAESLSEARQILESRGLETSKAAVQRAGWHILREKIYDMAQRAGLPADQWKEQNHYFRNVIGWNEPESQGFGGVGGPGGIVAMGMKAGKEVISKTGFPAFPFVFGNAMGIALNRKLAYTPLGFFPGIFKGSPWFEGERNIRQRKLEATIGTTLGSTLMGLAAAGIWQVLPQSWPRDDKERAMWVARGWQPGMVVVPVGDNQEMKIGTRVGPMALFSPWLAAGGAYNRAVQEQAKRQEALNEKAAKLGLQPEQLKGLAPDQWLAIMGQAAMASATGGRTASGMIGSYTDFGNLSPKKSGASAVSALVPALPAFQEVSRMAGSNINPKLASFWDLLVPLPTSDANRVNLLGDPMRNENDFERIIQVMSGGSALLPAGSEDFKKNHAYTQLFASDYRPPAIDPARGYQFGEDLRPMTEKELRAYTVLRGKNFSEELQIVDVTGLDKDAAKKTVQAAFQRANSKALSEVGAVPISVAASSGEGQAFAAPRSVAVAGGVTATRASGGYAGPRRGGRTGVRRISFSGPRGRVSRTSVARISRTRGGRRVSFSRRTRSPRSSIRIARIHRPSISQFVSS